MRWKSTTINPAEGLILIIISGLILPLVLMPIVEIFGYSEIIEEFFKALIVLFLALRFNSVKQKISAAVLFGFLFGLSENFFYFKQIFELGDISVFWQRFLLTIPMHITTVLVVLLFALKNKKWIILGLIGAVILHLIFNMVLAGA